MSVPRRKLPARLPREFPVNVHLLGCVDYEDCLSLQRRLAYDALSRADGRMVVLICEHPPLITIGRGGSRIHVRLTGSELAERKLEIRYVSRGGGAVLHCPGQLAIYPIVPLAWHGWTVGGYLRRLQSAVAQLLVELKVQPTPVPGSFSLLARTGVIAAIGLSVRHEVTTQGAFLNVNPAMRDFGRIETVPGRTMTSLLSHRVQPVKMTQVRAALVTHLAEAFAFERYHLHTGHPLLAELPESSQPRESAA